MPTICKGCGFPYSPGPQIHDPLGSVEVAGWCLNCAPAVLVDIAHRLVFDEACKRYEKTGGVK